MVPITELEFGKTSAVAADGKTLSLQHADAEVTLVGKADGGTVEARSGDTVLEKTELKEGDPDIDFITQNGYRYRYHATKT